jgi:plastocyanin
MKKTLTLSIACAASSILCAQTIEQTGLAFDPEILTVMAGEEITIILNPPHTATEVDEATWNANESTSNGGFDFSAGTHTLTLDVPGTYYYVCVPHAGMGMKGRIVVESGAGVAAQEGMPRLVLFPNPASTELHLPSAVAGQVLTLIDAQGRVALRHTTTGADRVDITTLAAGNYNATLSDAKNQVVAREQVTIVR